jgi:hypothetical protein
MLSLSDYGSFLKDTVHSHSYDATVLDTGRTLSPAPARSPYSHRFIMMLYLNLSPCQAMTIF